MERVSKAIQLNPSYMVTGVVAGVPLGRASDANDPLANKLSPLARNLVTGPKGGVPSVLQEVPSHCAMGPSGTLPSGLPAYESLPAATTDPRYVARADTKGLPKAPNPCMRSVHIVGSIQSIPRMNPMLTAPMVPSKLIPRKRPPTKRPHEVGVRFASHPKA